MSVLPGPPRTRRHPRVASTEPYKCGCSRVELDSYLDRLRIETGMLPVPPPVLLRERDRDDEGRDV
jgi:hypothetical protein